MKHGEVWRTAGGEVAMVTAAPTPGRWVATTFLTSVQVDEQGRTEPIAGTPLPFLVERLVEAPAVHALPRLDRLRARQIWHSSVGSRFIVIDSLEHFPDLFQCVGHDGPWAGRVMKFWRDGLSLEFGEAVRLTAFDETQSADPAELVAQIRAAIGGLHG